MANTVRIDNNLIATPSKIDVGKFRLTRSERTSSGKMVQELIATKRSVSLEWDYIAEPDLRAILDLLDTGVFHTLEYPDPQGTGGLKTITVYVGDISESAWYYVSGQRYWRDVRIGLIEQ